MVKAYIPYPKYVSISITGTACALNCRYCSRTYLKHMDNALSPQQLYWLMRKLYQSGVRGFLVSGGFTREGKLPFHSYLGVIRDFKREHDVVVSIHPGLIDRREARMLREARIDVVDLEFSLNPTFTEQVKGLGVKAVDRYAETLEALYKEGPDYIAPHILVGSSLGLIGNEPAELWFLKDYNPYIIVLLIYAPTKGTPSEKDPKPEPTYVLETLRYIRANYKGELSLGCMRPWGKYKNRVDDLILGEGLVDRIANPSKQLIDKYGLETIHACCSIPREYEYLFT